MRYYQPHLKILIHAVFVALTTLCLMQPAWAVATLTVVNNNGPGEGFNDPTPFISTGGNPATTLGDTRLIAFQFAANLWGSMVNSLVEIRIEAQFDPLPHPGCAGCRRGQYRVSRLCECAAGEHLVPGGPGKCPGRI